MRNKLISAVVALCMLLLLLPGCTADNSLTIYPVVSAQSAQSGDEVTVEVYIDNCERLCSAQFYLTYDALAFELKDYAETEVPKLLSAIGEATDTVGNAHIQFSCITQDTVDLSKTLLMTARFVVKDSAPDGDAFFGIAMDLFEQGIDDTGVDTIVITDTVKEGGATVAVTGTGAAAPPTDAATAPATQAPTLEELALPTLELPVVSDSESAS